MENFVCNTINENVHNKTNSELVSEVLRLRQAIRNHRDQKGDDRCWMDDEELYKVLPEGYVPPERDTTVELKLCEKYIQCRRNPKTKYVSPQRRIEELEKEVKDLRKFIRDDPFGFPDGDL